MNEEYLFHDYVLWIISIPVLIFITFFLFSIFIDRLLTSWIEISLGFCFFLLVFRSGLLLIAIPVCFIGIPLLRKTLGYNKLDEWEEDKGFFGWVRK